MDTPCINVCSIDPTSRLCTGCGRTINEIAAWASMTPAERRRIMDELPHRKAASAKPAAAGAGR